MAKAALRRRCRSAAVADWRRREALTERRCRSGGVGVAVTKWRWWSGGSGAAVAERRWRWRSGGDWSGSGAAMR